MELNKEPVSKLEVHPETNGYAISLDGSLVVHAELVNGKPVVTVPERIVPEVLTESE